MTQKHLCHQVHHNAGDRAHRNQNPGAVCVTDRWLNKLKGVFSRQTGQASRPESVSQQQGRTQYICSVAGTS